MNELTGILEEKFEAKSGTGKNGEWKKQEFLLDIPDDKFPRKVKFSCFNSKVDVLDTCKLGDNVKVFFDINAKEYKGNWYNDVYIIYINKIQGQKKEKTQQESSPDDTIKENDDLPF